ncbi:MAG: GNAT family N-acetyltransferase [Candidatus Heimdallarchaeota archaeon]|nr:MAG: GNAT family N-acetyltransferase [Candidatus Heimdallarchaeota archaeon]
MEYRLLNKEEIKRISEIDRTETVEYIYYHREGKLELVEEYYEINEWNQEEELRHISSLNDIYQRGGFIFGAFDKLYIVGIISLDNEFIGRNKDQLNLAGLWVSKDYRKKGVGKTLVELVKEKAKEMGARKLYVSATPSQNTVHFYMNRGFDLAKEVNEKLYELEPDDIHMECLLISDSK